MPTTISGTSGVTYPAGGTDNVAGSGVGTTDSQTLTNKTLTSPTLTTPTIATIKSAASATPTVFQDSAGTEVGTLSRAWVNFNGTTSPGTIRASFNVSSVTKNATGDYTVNFTNALADANYAAVGSAGGDNYNTYGAGVAYFNYNKATGLAVAPTTTAVRLIVGYSDRDQTYMYVSIFR